MRNPENPEGEPEAVWNAHRSPVVDMKAIAMVLEKDDQGKNKASNATEERGDAPPAVGVVKPGVVGSVAWTAGRYSRGSCDKQGCGIECRGCSLTSTRILYFYTNFGLRNHVSFLWSRGSCGKKAVAKKAEAVPRRHFI